jgi:tRNA pseudouridine55 synthase
MDPVGLIVVDKPAGMTSHDVVSRIRRLARTRRVGHGGTLDPMATGVLIIGVGKATRLLTYVIGSDKGYTATIRLGQATVTDDAEGDVVSKASVEGVTDEAIRAGLAAQTGEISQVPSAVSAIKVNGKRAYTMVRAGESVELAARRVTVSRLDVLDIRRSVTAKPDEAELVGTEPAGIQPAGARPGDAEPVALDLSDADVIDVDIDVACSSGTYIRAIARDLGVALGVGGHLTALRRTSVGSFSLAEASPLDELAARVDAGGDPMSLTLDEAAARFFTRRQATPEEAIVLSHGGPLTPTDTPGPYAVFGPSGQVLAIVAERDGKARAEIVFAPA